MKRIAVGCLAAVLCVLGLNAVLAQDATVAPDLPAEVTALATLPVEATISEPTLTETPTATVLPIEASATATLAPIDAATQTPTETLTQSIIILPTLDLTVTAWPSQTPTAAPTLALRAINGQALYPNRVLGQAFIRVQAFAADGSVLSTAYTDANGLYALAGLADQVTRVQIDAPLYLPEILYLAPGITPSVVTLRGGDLNGDICVGPADIAILTSHYGEVFAGADLDGSGYVDVVDLTLLSSSYDAECLPSDALLTPPPLATVEVTPGEATVISTDESAATQEITATETPMPTATEIIVSTATEIILPIATDTPLTVIPTAEATAEAS